MAADTELALEPIGIVRSPLVGRKDAPRSPADGPAAILDIDERFVAALEGVRPGMELIVVTWLHQAHRDVLQVHRRRDQTLPLTGVFTTRSPDRPNPIGIHRVTITMVDATRRLHVAALEAVDGTPILDLKAAVDPGEAANRTSSPSGLRRRASTS